MGIFLLSWVTRILYTELLPLLCCKSQREAIADTFLTVTDRFRLDSFFLVVVVRVRVRVRLHFIVALVSIVNPCCGIRFTLLATTTILLRLLVFLLLLPFLLLVSFGGHHILLLPYRHLL